MEQSFLEVSSDYVNYYQVQDHVNSKREMQKGYSHRENQGDRCSLNYWGLMVRAGSDPGKSLKEPSPAGTLIFSSGTLSQTSDEYKYKD